LRSPEVIISSLLSLFNRERRIVRAFDISAKKKELAPEVAAAYNPFEV